MQKYEFSVRTRNGHLVENIRIIGKDLPDAERKLRQMYIHCEIVQHETIEAEKPIPQSADIEDVLTLIVKHS
ncbi:MAG TPA: hypothetical protein VFF26_11865 [Gallionella sp.]|nr:hypothetical protein [Gallionella sp.]